jgi:hypothetical protein
MMPGKTFIRRAAILSMACCIGIFGTAPASAGSDFDTFVLPADYAGLGLPANTLVLSQYVGYIHSDAFDAPSDNILAKLNGGARLFPATFPVFFEITRVDYITRLWDHPFVIEAALPSAFAGSTSIGNSPFPTPTGLGPQTVNDGIIDPVIFFTYGLIADAKDERFFGFSTYFWIPSGNYDKFKQINVATPNQFTATPQFGYTEGLGKYAQGLKDFWFDVIANVSIHSDGSAPFATVVNGVPVQFNNLTQDPTFDLKFWFRYNYTQGGTLAVGLEKVWGGKQIMSGGVLGAELGPTALLEDNFLRGHLAAVVPLAKDFSISASVTHDFEREGFFREDFTFQVRLLKLFFSEQQEKPLK